MVKVYTSKAMTKPLDIQNNFERAQAEVAAARAAGAQLVVFPQGFLTGVQLGMLADARYMKNLYNSMVKKLAAANPDMYILADVYDGQQFKNAICHGDSILQADRFDIDGITFTSFNSAQRLRRTEHGGMPDCVILNESAPVLAGTRRLLHRMLAQLQMNINGCVIACLGGYGFTSHPDVYLPATAYISPCEDYFTTTLPEFLNGRNVFDTDEAGTRAASFALPSLDFDIVFNKNPLVPAQVDEREYCLDLFHLQSVSLAARMTNIGCKRAVVALSGGLDSALALLVTVNAYDLMGLDRSGIKVITMPGFGTSNTTKGLAGDLAASLGLELELIDITPACRQALLDIGHDATTPDVTFENVQARMRTLNGLNIANAIGGIMVGTGDLSEVCLGFSTYGGDHLASYGVNTSVSKTVIRTMLPYVTALDNLKSAQKPIDDILNIPVSPELVPHGGEILQKTEEILAPYKLIDFYIYCFIVAKMSPIEMAQRASCVFEGEFTASYLREKAQMLCRRFITGQFKRSAAPEGAALTHAHLGGRARSLPSDSSMGIFNHYLNI